MPANLSQRYRNAEKQYRRANTLEDELLCLEQMLREIPKHKGTDKLQADLKKRISQTRKRIQQPAGRKPSAGFRVPRQGSARVVIIGGPNSGKTSLFNALTHSSETVAEFPFSTTHPQPALMTIAELKIQLIDTPPVTSNDLDPRTESLIRGADLVLLLVDVVDEEAAERLRLCYESIQNSRTRLGTKTRFSESDIGVTYTQTMLVWTMGDSPDSEEHRDFVLEYLGDCFPAELSPGTGISVVRRTGLEQLKDSIFQRLDLIRVYTRQPTDKQVDRSDPWGLPRGASVMDLALEIHEELARHFFQARVWGKGKHDGMVVNGDYELDDLDIVEIRTR